MVFQLPSNAGATPTMLSLVLLVVLKQEQQKMVSRTSLEYQNTQFSYGSMGVISHIINRKT
jgi:hypothetical protein